MSRDFTLMMDLSLKNLQFELIHKSIIFYLNHQSFRFRKRNCQRRILGIKFSIGYVDYYELKFIVLNHLKNVDVIYTSGHQKLNFLQQKLEELKMNRIQLKNLENYYVKMESDTPICLNHNRGLFRCAINNVNKIYDFVEKNEKYIKLKIKKILFTKKHIKAKKKFTIIPFNHSSSYFFTFQKILKKWMIVMFPKILVIYIMYCNSTIFEVRKKN